MKRLYEFVINSKSTGIIKNINTEFIDLGLSVLWAKCNIGAEEETDYGHYYQWGGLEPMDNKSCDWTTAPFNDGNDDFDKDYFDSIKDKVCPNGVLAKEYDIAYQTYGGKVRMPTLENFNELRHDTNREWIKNYLNTGMNGYKFTNKSYSTKFIFMPCAGYRLESTDNSVCSDGLMWSASLYDVFHSAWRLGFYNDSINSSFNERVFGFTVRAVKDK